MKNLFLCSFISFLQVIDNIGYLSYTVITASLILYSEYNYERKITMFCPHCGAKADDGALFCSSCGSPIQAPETRSNPEPNPQTGYQQSGSYQPSPYYQNNQNYAGGQNAYGNQPAEPDAPNAGFAILGFFIPIVGIILYFAFRDATPLKAKSCLKGALVAIICSVVISILCVIIAILIPAIMMGSQI